MHRKILGIYAALVAFAAFALIPAMAAASPVLTEGGVKATVGNKILATGEETSEFTSGFVNVTCNKYKMTGTLSENSGTSVKGTIESATFENSNEVDCSSNLGPTEVTIPGLTGQGGTSHWCVEANTFNPDEVLVQPHSCGGTGGEFTFVLDVTNAPLLGTQLCRYTRSTAIPATFTTGTGTLKLKGTPSFAREATSSSSCSETGNLTKMSFNLETDVSPFTGLTIS